MRSILTDSLSDEWVSLSRGGGRIAEGSEKVDEGGWLRGEWQCGERVQEWIAEFLE